MAMLTNAMMVPFHILVVCEVHAALMGARCESYIVINIDAFLF